MSKFILGSATITDRYTEPRDIPVGMIMPPKHEEVNVTINLIGSGNTITISNKDILDAIFEMIPDIEKL